MQPYNFHHLHAFAGDARITPGGGNHIAGALRCTVDNARRLRCKSYE
jgi:hypothetical protein